MKTSAKDLAAWAADQPPELEIWAGAKKPEEFPAEQAVRESVGYSNRVDLMAATADWQSSIGGPTDRRLAAWARLVKAREEFEAAQEET